MHMKFYSGTLKGRDHSQVVSVYGKIILRWMLNKWNGGVVMWVLLVLDQSGTSVGLVKYASEPWIQG